MTHNQCARHDSSVHARTSVEGNCEQISHLSVPSPTIGNLTSVTSDVIYDDQERLTRKGLNDNR